MKKTNARLKSSLELSEPEASLLESTVSCHPLQEKTSAAPLGKTLQEKIQPTGHQNKVSLCK